MKRRMMNLAVTALALVAISAASAQVIALGAGDPPPDKTMEREIRIEVKVVDGKQKVVAWIDGKRHDIESVEALEPLLEKEGVATKRLAHTLRGDDVEQILKKGPAPGKGDGREEKQVIVKRLAPDQEMPGAPHVVKQPRAMLGVQLQEVPPAVGEYLGLGKDEGVMIGSVIDRSAAAKAGLKPRDIVVAMSRPDRDDVIKVNIESFRRSIAESEPGMVVTLKVLRKGIAKRVRVKLQKWDSSLSVGMEQPQILRLTPLGEGDGAELQLKGLLLKEGGAGLEKLDELEGIEELKELKLDLDLEGIPHLDRGEGGIALRLVPELKAPEKDSGRDVELKRMMKRMQQQIEELNEMIERLQREQKDLRKRLQTKGDR